MFVASARLKVTNFPLEMNEFKVFRRLRQEDCEPSLGYIMTPCLRHKSQYQTIHKIVNNI